MSDTIPRVDHETVLRPTLDGPPYAMCVIGGTCEGCGDEIDPGDDVVLSGQATVHHPDGRVEVDLTGGEWIHARCWVAS